MANVISILNEIRKYASADYIANVPLATRDNFVTVGAQIVSYSLQSNEFVDALVNRIAMTVVNNRQFKNPLSVLNKGSIPLGQDVQEIYLAALVAAYEYHSNQLDYLHLELGQEYLLSLIHPGLAVSFYYLVPYQ